MPKARKDYTCDLCELLISKGSDYHYQRVTPWDHPANERFGDFRAHRYCYSVWVKLDWDDYDVDAFREEITGLAAVVIDYDILEAIVNQTVLNVVVMPVNSAAELADKVL